MKQFLGGDGFGWFGAEAGLDRVLDPSEAARRRLLVAALMRGRLSARGFLERAPAAQVRTEASPRLVAELEQVQRLEMARALLAALRAEYRRRLGVSSGSAARRGRRFAAECLVLGGGGGCLAAEAELLARWLDGQPVDLFALAESAQALVPHGRGRAWCALAALEEGSLDRALEHAARFAEARGTARGFELLARVHDAAGRGLLALFARERAAAAPGADRATWQRLLVSAEAAGDRIRAARARRGLAARPIRRESPEGPGAGWRGGASS